MNVKKRMWQRGLLFLLLGLFFTCPAFVSGAVTPYPYDQVGVIIGFSGVYDILTIHKFWEKANANEDKYYKCTKASGILTDWLNNISSNGGNVIRFFSHGNWQPAPKEIPITPWKREANGKYNCNPDAGQWNEFYWTRLDNLMIELKNRKLTAWIDIWDFCSLKWRKEFFDDKEFKKFLYIKHPFYNNNHGFVWPGNPANEADKTGLNMFFSSNATIKEWRQKFEKELVNRTKSKYNPIYSTNEVLDKNYSAFLIDITNYLIGSPLNVKKNRISHSPYPSGEYFRNTNNNYLVNPSALVKKFENQLMLATHGNSLATRIVSDDLSKYGIKVISSDAEGNGGITGFGDKKPLTAEQAKTSMIKALNIGFLGLELLDRDEYQYGYNEDKVDLYNLDANAGVNHKKLDTLTHMIAATKDISVSIRVRFPNGGEQFYRGEVNDIMWYNDIPDQYKWGTISIYLYQGSTKVGSIVEKISPDSLFYTWTVGNLKNGTTVPYGSNYRIQIIRVNNSGHEMIPDFSDGYFSIIKPPPPVNAAN